MPTSFRAKLPFVPEDMYKQFHLAFESEQPIERFQYLISWCQLRNIDLKSIKNASRRTLTHYAMAYSRDDVLLLLAENKALSEDVKDKAGLLPGQYAKKPEVLGFSENVKLTLNPKLAPSFKAMVKRLKVKKEQESILSQSKSRRNI